MNFYMPRARFLKLHEKAIEQFQRAISQAALTVKYLLF